MSWSSEARYELLTFSTICSTTKDKLSAFKRVSSPSVLSCSFLRSSCCRQFLYWSVTCRQRAQLSTLMRPMPWRGCSRWEAPATPHCEYSTCSVELLSPPSGSQSNCTNTLSHTHFKKISFIIVIIAIKRIFSYLSSLHVSVSLLQRWHLLLNSCSTICSSRLLFLVLQKMNTSWKVILTVPSHLKLLSNSPQSVSDQLQSYVL